MFISSYTLEQFAAFCLASNWAQNQHEEKELARSQHFFNFFEKHFQDEQVSLHLRAPEPIKEIRNFFSHTTSVCISKLEKERIESLKKILRNCILEILYVRKKKLEEGVNEVLKKAEKSEDELKKLFNFDENSLGQPEIAFVLSPFLTRSQMSFLVGKVYFGKGSYKKTGSDGKAADTPLTLARKEILKTLSPSDNIVLRKSESVYDPWLSPKHEQGFAIWGLFEKHYENPEAGQKEDEFPSDWYFMRQLLLFVECNKVLPGISFARVETEIHEGRNEQSVSFEADDNCPFAIRHNTIKIRLEESRTEGTMGLQALKYIVAIYLLPNQRERLAEWVKGWYLENKEYPERRAGVPTNSEDLKERARLRLEYLVKLRDKEPRNLQEQIRFICNRIGVAHNKKYGRSPGKEEYKKLEERVRFYEKEILIWHLNGLKLLDVEGIQLGEDDKGKLRNLIKDETIQDLYGTLSRGYRDWLAGCKGRIHKLGDGELRELGEKIGLRKVKERKENPDFPVGLSPLDIRKEFANDKNSPVRFFGLAQKLGPKPNLPEKCPALSSGKKVKEQWARKRLLFAMAYNSVEDLLPDKAKAQIESGKEFPKISETPIRIDTGNRHVTLNLSKAWRNMAYYPKNFLENLIKVYLDEEKGGIPLFRADEKKEKEGVSIESSLQEMRNERFLLIQALLKWEKDFVEKNRMQPKNQSYICFKCIAKKASLDEVVPLRNAAFHDKIGNKRFSYVPQPIKGYYDELDKQRKQKNANSRKKAGSKTRHKT